MRYRVVKNGEPMTQPCSYEMAVYWLNHYLHTYRPGQSYPNRQGVYSFARYYLEEVQ